MTSSGFRVRTRCRVRLLIQEGRALEACAIEPPDLELSLNAMRGEVIASRGLRLPSLGRVDEAIEPRGGSCSDDRRALRRGCLATAIDAVCACAVERLACLMRASTWSRPRSTQGPSTSSSVHTVATQSCWWRCCRSALARDSVLHIVVRAGDEGLANALGSETITATDPIKALSRREREVYDLVCEGLSNAEIAQRLFITEATVKVHVHHVFDKVGVRSRTALAMNAARDRWRHAAFSANPDPDDGAEESPASATIPASSE